MTRNRLLTCLALALAAAFSAPAAAQAGAGPGDDISQAISPPTPGGVLPLSTIGNPHILGFEVDTSAYTVEAGSEPLRCARSNTTYGNTVWGVFKAPQYGRLDVTAAGFDSVITLVDANAARSANPIVDCTDRLAGKIESFPRDGLPTVKKGHVYGVQIGGATRPDGSVPAGPLAVDLELIRPDKTVGDAVLSWLGSGGGVKIKSLKVNAPRGSVVTVGCVKRSCGKVRSFGVRKPVFREKVGVDYVARLAAGPVAAGPIPAERSFAKTTAFAAAGPNLNGKRIKNGDTLLVAIQAEDQIGIIYFWQVGRGQAGTKNVGCIEPNSTKIKRVGTCTGR
jgi:hypothetical protein